MDLLLTGVAPLKSVTRLAPSPTGALHLGNARTFLINWLLARQSEWTIALRIEDLDGPRIKPSADRQLIEDLHWLGLNWDVDPVWQSARLPSYQAAINQLLSDRLAYPCVCSRKEAQQAASAPHAEELTSVYSGTCRGKWRSVEEAFAQTGRIPAIRFIVPDQEIAFVDQFAGPQRINPARTIGDFVIAKADGTPAYQIAVVVDDVAAEVKQVVRGDDLLDSVPRQILLYRALGWGDRIPFYTHLPLVIGIDGRRLAKRHGDTRLAHYREAGTSAPRLLALLARWCGIEVGASVDDPTVLLEHFDLNRVSRQSITFTPDDDAWLLQES